MDITQWDVSIHVDNNGAAFVTLHEDGKIDYEVAATEAQGPWFNALRRLIRLSKADADACSVSPQPAKDGK